MAYMTLQAVLPMSGCYVELTGPDCEVWEGWPVFRGNGPSYAGPIEGMPAAALDEAVKLGYIKQR